LSGLGTEIAKAELLRSMGWTVIILTVRGTSRPY